MNYIENIIAEEIKNKKLFNAMLTKWREEKPELTEQEAENIFNRFSEVQNGLNPKKPQIITFLFRFDGVEYPKFEARDLKDITKYNFEQIMFLLGEYSQGEEGFNTEVEVDDGDFGKVNSHFSEENIEKSRNMWFGQAHAVVNEDGFRVFFIPNQRVSIKFGYFLKASNQAIGRNSPLWCVTDYSGNLWSNYRNERTFYFVIDESKGNEDRYRFGALQRDTSVRDGYKLTSRFNDGDQTKSWDEIINIYPKLAEHKDAIVPVRYNEKDELNKDTRSVIDMISEQPGRYEFKRQSKNLKRRYITGGRNISKPESWQSMDSELRTLYIHSVTANNYRSKFPNYALLMEVGKVKNEMGSLDHRLNIIGLDGVSTLFDFLMEAEFRVSKTNIENPNIKIYRSRTNGTLGIFNANTANWYQKGGVIYEPIYAESRPKLYKNAQNPTEKFFVIVYSTPNGDDTKNFYCIIPISRSKTSGYLLSAQAFNAMREEIVEDAFMGTLPKSPEGEHDIK